MERGRITVFAVISAVLIAAGVLFTLLFAGNIRDHPEIVLPDIPPVSPSHEGTGDGSGSEPVEVNSDTVQAVVATLKRPDSYSRVLHVQSMWGNESAEYDISMWVKGPCLRLSVTSEKWDEEKNILMDDGRVTIWYGTDTGSRYTVPRNELEQDTILGDELGMIPTYESILKLDAGDIIDAGYVDFNGQRIMAAAKDSALGYMWYYYVSTDTGLLEAAEVWDGDTPVYRMISEPAELNAPDDSMFILD